MCREVGELTAAEPIGRRSADGPAPGSGTASVYADVKRFKGRSHEHLPGLN
jgi:hypothetical protein